MSKNLNHSPLNWRSEASLEALKKRAELLALTRAFFFERNVLEVETPLLGKTAGTDLQLEPFRVLEANATYYLQTSPEFAMKRLLAAGSGPIYQLCKAFRQDEVGHKHNPEFTMLEWYHPNIDHHTLMEEVDALLCLVLKTEPADKVSYFDLFNQFFKSTYDDITLESLRALVLQFTSFSEVTTLDKSTCFDLLFSMVIEPKIGIDRPIFVYDYPIEQKALAKVNLSSVSAFSTSSYIPVAERFEVYYKGVELANGYHELTDTEEQRKRFEDENKIRTERGQMLIDIDYKLVSALEYMPPSSGVALGFDRLCMLAMDKNHIKDIISFTFERI